MLEGNQAIWSYAEPGLEEHRSSKELQDWLQENGFSLRAGVSGMPTALQHQGVMEVLGVLALAWLAASGPALSFESDPESADFGTVLASGLSAEARRVIESGEGSRVFPVRLEGVEDAPPILGTYTVEANGVRFRPRFTFQAGLQYRAELEGEADLVFVMPDRRSEGSPRVEALYPSAVEVPENLLRLYVVFSEPMWAKEVARHIRLLDSEGREQPLPFVEIDSGLWDAEGRRLTLFFHPGRLKRGVGPNAALGPPLKEGGRYRLVVDAGLKDVRGYELFQAFEREFRVGAPDRSSPDPAKWTVRPPSEATSSVTVDFDEALDRALLLRLVRVETASGKEVAGTGAAEDAERRWSFTPTEPWAPGDYRVVVDPEIEDLAGNAPFRLFDRETGEAAEVPERIRLEFQVRRASKPRSGSAAGSETGSSDRSVPLRCEVP